MYLFELGEMRTSGIKGDTASVNLALCSMSSYEWKNNKEVVEAYVMNRNVDVPVNNKKNKLKKI